MSTIELEDKMSTIELEDKIPPTLLNRVFQFFLTSVERAVFLFGTLFLMPLHGVNRLLHSCKASSHTVLDGQENDLELEDPNCKKSAKCKDNHMVQEDDLELKDRNFKKSEIGEGNHMEEIQLVGPLTQAKVSRHVSLHIRNDSGQSKRYPFRRGFFSGRNGIPLLANYFTTFGTDSREKQLFEGESDDEVDEIKEQVRSVEEPQSTTTGGKTIRKVAQRIQRRRAAAEEKNLDLAVTDDEHSEFAHIETGLMSSMWHSLKTHFHYYRYGYESEYDAGGAANAVPATESADPGAGPSSAPEFVPTTRQHYDLVDSYKVKKDARFQKRFYKRSHAGTVERNAEGVEEVVTCSSTSEQEPALMVGQVGDGTDLDIGERQVQEDCRTVNEVNAREYRAVQGSIEEESVQFPAKVMFIEPGICPQVSIDISSPDKLCQTKDNATWNAQREQALDLTAVTTKILMYEGEVSYTAQEPTKTEDDSAASTKRSRGEKASAVPLEGLEFVPLEGLALQLSDILLKSPKKLQQPATHDVSSKHTSPIESIFSLPTEAVALLAPTKSEGTSIPTIVITEPIPESPPTIKNPTPKQKYKQEHVLKRDVTSPTKRDHREHSPTSQAGSECSPEKIPKTEHARIVLEHIKPLGVESENSSDDTIEYCMENIDFDTKSELTDLVESTEEAI